MKRFEWNVADFFKSGYIPLALALAAGVVLSTVLFYAVRAWEQELIATQFHWRAASHAASLRRAMLENVALIDFYNGLFTATPDVDRTEFRAFARNSLLDHTDIGGLLWAPCVDDAARPALVEAARRDGIAGFELSEGELYGNRRPAARRALYAPVYFAVPVRENQALMGYDILADGRLRPALEEARDTGATVTTGRIERISGGAVSYEALILEPVYRYGARSATLEDRRANLKGYLGAFVEVGAWVEESLQDRSVAGLDILVFDEAAPPAQRFLYLHRSRAEPRNKHPLPGRVPRELRHQVELKMPGRRWSVLFVPAPAFLAEFTAWRARMVYGSGLLFTLLLGAYLVTAQRQTARIRGYAHELARVNGALESEIAQRRAVEGSLRRSEASLALAQHIGHMGNLELDLRTGVLRWSDEAGWVLGLGPWRPGADKKLLLESVHPEDREHVHHVLERAAADRTPFVVEHRVAWPDGRERTVRQQGEYAVPQNGEPPRLLITAQDVTEQKDAQQRLQQSYDTVSTILDNLDAVVYVVALESDEVLFVNQRARQIFGDGGDDGYRNLMERFAQPDPRSGPPPEQSNGVRIREAYSAADERWYECRDQIIRWRDGRDVRLEIAVDATERKRSEERVRHLASHDALTGLPNRLLFSDRVQVALTRTGRTGGMAAVLFVDLDGFKYVNDAFGHEVGDRLLQDVAARLQGCVRRADTVARIGGDEFVILLTDVTDAEGAARVADTVIRSLAGPFTVKGERLNVGASVGIALYPEHGATAHALIRRADAAMYQAKRQGKNCYRFALPTAAGS